jgi:hypothetical protein
MIDDEKMLGAPSPLSRRQYQPDDEEQLLEEASSDLGREWRQRELEGLRGWGPNPRKLF